MNRAAVTVLIAFAAGAIVGGSALVLKHRLAAPDGPTRAQLEGEDYWRRVIEEAR